MNENSNDTRIDTAGNIDERYAINTMDEHLLDTEMDPNSRLHVEFDDLSYSVSNSKDRTKKILKNISGCFRPGKLTVIIGPSGAGKSTLLRIISTVRTTRVRGTIMINGAQWNGDAFRKKTCFVPQEFALLPLLTTKETLYIAARLKLNSSGESRASYLIVNEIAENLGLMNCLDTKVENLSGGERKRLSIGIEMITKPSVLLLDEPTSGLDSTSSNQVITLLHKVARAGCTVACAIHQPSSRMISQFDDILILHEGKCFYCGPWDEILNTFSSVGYVCPQFYNIAEFVLEVVTKERDGDLESLYKISHDNYLRRRIQYRRLHADTNASTVEKFQAGSECVANMLQASTAWEQQKVLFSRAFICIKRDNTMTKLRFTAHVIVACLLGVVFYDCGNNASRTSSNIACVFFILLFLYFSSAMPAVQMFPTEAAVFLREYLNNWYYLRSYYIVKIVSDLPLQIFAPSVFIAITYYMTGQPMEYDRFARTWASCVLTTILGQSSGVLTGLAFNAQIGVFLIPALSMPMILFAGFFLKFSEMPLYLQPLCMISFFRYSFEGIIQAIYDGDRTRLPCAEIYCYLSSPRKILQELNMPAVSYHTTVLMLCVWIVCLQILIYMVLKWKSYASKR